MSDLIDFILSVFGLGSDAIATIASAIKDAVLSMIQSAYRLWNALFGANQDDWTPSQDTIDAVEQVAQDQAETIAATYGQELGNAVDDYLSAYQDANGSLDGAIVPLSQMLGDWTETRMIYKSQQIAGYETGSGMDQGTMLFVQDLVSGGLIDTETGEVLDPSNYGVGVIPGESSSDICKEYAGQLFPLEEAFDIPDFPVHPWCPHEKILVPLNGGESEF